MKVLLAGHNLDYDLIRELKNASSFQEDLTPETISAAYARISRSPKSVDDLRRDARAEVDKARRSNRNIVFDMGHASVAEHAVFNIDVIGVSRLLVEEIEKFRLCSFTEKSQRYVLFNKDYVVPEEIRKAGMDKDFTQMVDRQNDLYAALYEALRPYVFDQNPDLAADPSNRSMLEGWAKEDARYAISLATETQLGMTVNARNLELMLRRLSALPLAEARLLSENLYHATQTIAPSLIRYTQATDYDRLTRAELRQAAQGLSLSRQAAGTEVKLIGAAKDADLRVAAALLLSSTQRTYDACFKQAKKMTARELKGLFRTAFAHLQPYDAVLREFEYVDLFFELVMSASCFAQFKRHRMATLVCQDYDPALGVTVPPAIRRVGRQKEFLAMIRETNRLFESLREKTPEAAPYALTNAHRRRVLLKLNARELYHVARLRSDAHAQWDIRALTDKMLKQARRTMPLTLWMAVGKDGFAARRASVFAGRR